MHNVSPFGLLNLISFNRTHKILAQCPLLWWRHGEEGITTSLSPLERSKVNIERVKMCVHASTEVGTALNYCVISEAQWIENSRDKNLLLI